MKALKTLVVSLSLATLAQTASAQIFDTGVGNDWTTRGPEEGGIGQRLAVATTTSLTNMGFYLGTQGATLKFMIWDDAGSNLLFSTTKEVSEIPTWTLVLADPFSFTLNSGSTYLFGVIASGGEFATPYFYPSQTLTMNGISVSGDNANFYDFEDPYYGDDGGVSLSLALFGTQEPVPTPEPASVVLVATGLLGVVGYAKRRRAIA